ncbi:UNVERIFIED_CONTAM: hypothetical protein GTU68_005966 [Idotea baltica]|nr:hypothetical protein [Idotea baltica]
MSASLIKSAVVIGAGQMGSGIAQVFVTKGIPTTLIDSYEGVLPKAKSGIERRLDRGIEKERMSAAEKTAAMEKLSFTADLDAATDCDIVVEAIIENTEIKIDLLKKLDSLVKPTGILATNTSSISITKLAAATSRPEKVIGLHFMNPVPVMSLVEVIRGLATSDQTYESCIQFVKEIGKESVTAARDFPGFIVNRILVPMINEAFFALMEGVATAEDIDTAMKLGTNQPMGPLQLADFVGLDTCLAICKIYHLELGEDKYRPCPLLVKYVEAGWYGKKVGRGVYQYS